MSLSAHLLSNAAASAADEAVHRLKLDPWTAEKLALVATALLLYGLRRKTRTPLGAAGLAFHLHCYREDLLANRSRLAAVDIRARGEAVLSRTFGRHRGRAQRAIAELGAIDPHHAAILFAMVAAASVSALSQARRDISLNAFQLQGVIKIEAARLDGADPALVSKISAWVFRPLWPAQIWEKMRARLANSAISPRIALQPAE